MYTLLRTRAHQEFDHQRMFESRARMPGELLAVVDDAAA